jgi:hypothetical protein
MLAAAPPVALVWAIYAPGAAVLLFCWLNGGSEYVSEDGWLKGGVKALPLGCWFGLLAFVAYVVMVAPWR